MIKKVFLCFFLKVIWDTFLYESTFTRFGITRIRRNEKNCGILGELEVTIANYKKLQLLIF